MVWTSYAGKSGAKHSKAKCSNFGPTNRRPQNYDGRRPKMGGGPDRWYQNAVFAISSSFWSRRALLLYAIGISKRVYFTGINRLAVCLQKLHFMKALFSRNIKCLTKFNGAKQSKAKCSNFGLKNLRPQIYVGRRPNMGGVQIDGIKNEIFGPNHEFLKPHRGDICCNVNNKACRFYWYKPFGCAPPKASLYEATFSQNSKVKK